jgi:tetratricopeptide (TPR) repeat protein
MRSLFVLGLMYMVAVAGEDTPRANLDQGVADLRAGRIAEAVTRLDRVVAQDPAAEPYLWQRGIAQYFAGDFKGGRKQFESHRTVNPNDVENATWHFLCVAASDGVEAARAAFLPAPGDARAPMSEIYALYKGTGDRAAVEAAVNRYQQGTPRYRDARFYADLYIGLLAHAEGNKEEAAKFLKAAADVEDQNVMADVARVSYKLLVKKDI